MQATVIDSKIPTERVDDLVAAVTAGIASALRDSPGFRGAYWLGDRTTGLVRAVVFVESAGQASARQEQSGHVQRNPVDNHAATLRAVGGREPQAETYDVLATEGPLIQLGAQFCRSIVWQEDPHQLEQTTRRIETGVIPGVRQNPGFQGGFWLVDRVSGRCVGCTLWDTIGHFEASGEVGRQLRRAPIERGAMQVLGLQQFAILARTATSASASR